MSLRSQGLFMSTGKVVALGAVVFMALMLVAYGLMRLHTNANRETIAENVEKARERISATIGADVMLKDSTYDFPWICGTYRDPGGEARQYSYQVREDRLGLERTGDDVSDYCKSMLHGR
jgi:hypothetical protein